MKTAPLTLTAFFVSSFFILHSASGQGTLTPPGAPAPTMKSLDQIEARVPISSAPYTITNPGSYYLTANLNLNSGGNGITIAASGVTLDLNGFTISSTSYPFNSGYGILISSNLNNLAIKNGFIHAGTVDTTGTGFYSGGGFGYGIDYSGSQPTAVCVSHVAVSGVAYYGINLGGGNAVIAESCTVNIAGESGIVATTVKNCVATDCGLDGIVGYQVSDSRGDAVSSVDGVAGISARNVQNCYGFSQSGSGIFADTALNSEGSSNGNTDGLEADAAQNCYGFSENGDAIYATAANNCFGESFGSGNGLNVSTAHNCYGYSTTGYGINATTANNCYGESSYSDGIYTFIATACYGQSNDTGYGLYAIEIATGCYGYSTSGTGLRANIANSCSGTSLSITHNLNSY